MEFVYITHPESEGAKPARVTREAFDLIHQAKGFQIVPGPDAAPEPVENPEGQDPAPDPVDPVDPAPGTPGDQPDPQVPSESTGVAPAKKTTAKRPS